MNTEVKEIVGGDAAAENKAEVALEKEEAEKENDDE